MNRFREILAEEKAKVPNRKTMTSEAISSMALGAAIERFIEERLEAVVQRVTEELKKHERKNR